MDLNLDFLPRNVVTELQEDWKNNVELPCKRRKNSHRNEPWRDEAKGRDGHSWGGNWRSTSQGSPRLRKTRWYALVGHRRSHRWYCHESTYSCYDPCSIDDGSNLNGLQSVRGPRSCYCNCCRCCCYNRSVWNSSSCSWLLPCTSGGWQVVAKKQAC